MMSEQDGAVKIEKPRACHESLLPFVLLREFSRSAPGRDVALQGLLAALLSNLLRLTNHATAGQEPIASAAREIVARYRQLLEASYRQHLEISSYARALGISEAQLRRALSRSRRAVARGNLSPTHAGRAEDIPACAAQRLKKARRSGPTRVELILASRGLL